jgi:hypothetical protein
MAAASFIETGGTATLHAMCATALGTLIDGAAVRFSPPPAELGAGVSLLASEEVKQALVLLVQFNVGILATRNLMELVLPSAAAYQSPISSDIWTLFFFTSQPGLLQRVRVLVGSITQKLDDATNGLLASNASVAAASQQQQ